MLGLIAFICTGILFWPLRIIDFTQLSTSLAGNSSRFWELLQNKDSREAISTIATIFGGLFVFGNLIVVVENLKQTRKNNEINDDKKFNSYPTIIKNNIYSGSNLEAGRLFRTLVSKYGMHFRNKIMGYN